MQYYNLITRIPVFYPLISSVHQEPILLTSNKIIFSMDK